MNVAMYAMSCSKPEQLDLLILMVQMLNINTIVYNACRRGLYRP